MNKNLRYGKFMYKRLPIHKLQADEGMSKLYKSISSNKIYKNQFNEFTKYNRVDHNKIEKMLSSRKAEHLVNPMYKIRPYEEDAIKKSTYLNYGKYNRRLPSKTIDNPIMNILKSGQYNSRFN